jgi:hypothetical protein
MTHPRIIFLRPATPAEAANAARDMCREAKPRGCAAPGV